MRSISLYKINHGDPKADEAIFHLNESLTPITYDEAAVELGRFLQHYPRRHIEQDAVFVQDIADELEFKEFGLVVVVMTLREIRNELRKYKDGTENPWPPQTGYILTRVQQKQNSYSEHLKRILTPPRAKIKESIGGLEVREPRIWADMDENLRLTHLRTLRNLDKRIQKAYRRALEIPDSVEVEA